MKKAHWFWPLATVIAGGDFLTKRVAENSLSYGQPHEVIGNFLRFTLGYNTGIAFGIPFGIGARPLLIAFTLAAIAGIIWIFRSTSSAQRLQLAALSLILGGAVGNLLDRFRSSRGVVDFIDIGIGDRRFWTFNIADSAITIGAILIVIASFTEEREQRSPDPKHRL